MIGVLLGLSEKIIHFNQTNEKAGEHGKSEAFRKFFYDFRLYAGAILLAG